MDSVLIIVIVFAVCALIVGMLRPVQQPPPVIYVQTEQPQSNGMGCLMVLFIVIAFLLLVTINPH